jgi:hypothetical protein
MSISLVNSNGNKTEISNIGWAFYLNLASAFYGWIEAGTDAPDDWDSSQEWEGHYDWNAGQIIRSDDAENFAKALEKYLVDPARFEKANSLAQELSNIVGYEVTADLNDHSFVSNLIAALKDEEIRIW